MSDLTTGHFKKDNYVTVLSQSKISMKYTCTGSLKLFIGHIVCCLSDMSDLTTGHFKKDNYVTVLSQSKISMKYTCTGSLKLFIGHR